MAQGRRRSLRTASARPAGWTSPADRSGELAGVGVEHRLERAVVRVLVGFSEPVADVVPLPAPSGMKLWIAPHMITPRPWRLQGTQLPLRQKH